MKIIFLNTWDGKVEDALTNFLKEQSADTDIFCFQEVFARMNTIREKILPDFTAVSAARRDSENVDFSNTIYVKPSIEILSRGTVLNGSAPYIEIAYNGSILSLCNMHGFPHPADKQDTKQRLEQSEELIETFKDAQGPVIIGGDFNLDIGTQSISLFAEKGYRNLIAEYGVTTTRNQLIWSKYPNNVQYFADFVFVKGDIKVSSFEVPNIEISDHLPLILTFDIAS